MSMGLLSPSPPPWHPAPPELKAAVSQLQDVWPSKLPNLALGYSIRNTGATHGNVPLVVGFSQPDEVRECVSVWWELQRGVGNDDRKKVEDEFRVKLENMGFLDWSWASP
jgi:D-arabinose 1-dehydrogenase